MSSSTNSLRMNNCVFAVSNWPAMIHDMKIQPAKTPIMMTGKDFLFCEGAGDTVVLSLIVVKVERIRAVGEGYIDGFGNRFRQDNMIKPY